MLVLFSLACLFSTVHVSYGQVGCLGIAQARLMNCIRPLQLYLQSGPQEKQALCGQARGGLQCARNVISECDAIGNSPLQQMVQGFSMVEGDINSNCNEIIPEPFVTEAPPVITEAPPVVTESSNEISVCGKIERRTLLRCSRKLQRFAAETPIRCGRVRRAMDCMSTLLEKCRSSIRGETVAKVESLRGNLMGLCVEANDVDIGVTAGPVSMITTTLRPPPVGSGCPPNLSEKIQECMVPIQNTRPSLGKAAVCRLLNRGMTCLDELVSRCSSIPGFNDVARLIDQTRIFVTSQCSGSWTNLGIGESDICPLGDLLMLSSCSAKWKLFMESGDTQNKQMACSLARDHLGCIRQLFADCSNKSKIKAIGDLLEVHQRTEKMCSSVVPMSNDSISAISCKYKDPGSQLLECNRIMNKFHDKSLKFINRCRFVFKGFFCFDKLIASCPTEKEVVKFTSMVNLDKAKGALFDICPA